MVNGENKANHNTQNSTLIFSEIRKRDGRIVPFDPEKITDAIFKAAQAVGGSDRDLAVALTNKVNKSLQKKVQNSLIPTVEEVQDEVEIALIENGHARTAKAYILYRDKRTRIRDRKSELMDVVKDILVDTSPENGLKHSSPSSKMLEIAKAASKQYYLSNLIPGEYARAFEEGSIYIHNLEYYSKALCSLQIDLARFFKNNLPQSSGLVSPARNTAQAVLRAAVILTNSQNDLFGGQAFPYFDQSLAGVLESMDRGPDLEEVSLAMENLFYYLNEARPVFAEGHTGTTINLGGDTTFWGRMVTRAVFKVLKRWPKRGKLPLSPHLVFRLKKEINLEPESLNYDLYQMALEAASKGASISFSFMDSSFNRPYALEASYMRGGSRMMENRHGESLAAARGSIAGLTINLPRLALKSKGLSDLFFVELDRLLRLASRQLLHRFEVLSRLKAADLPFLIGQGLYSGAENLEAAQSIRDVIKNGTLDLGFCGLAEALKVLTGKTQAESSEAHALGLKIAEHMRRRIDNYSDEYDLNFTLTAGPSAGCERRFIKKDREDFGLLAGVTDSERYSASFQILPSLSLDPLEKIKLEGGFHRFCQGGHVSTVPLELLPVKDLNALDQVVMHMLEADCGYGSFIST